MSCLYVVSLKSEVLYYIFDNLREKSSVEFIIYQTKPPTFLRSLFQYLLIGRIPLPSFILTLWFDKKFINSLSKITSRDSLLIIEKINPRILRAIAWAVPFKINKYVWLWNPLNTYYIARKKKNTLKKHIKTAHKTNPVAVTINKIKKIGYTVCTFDNQDAKKYDLVVRNQLFRFPAEFTKQKVVNDFYFLGQSKNRKKELMDLFNKLSAMNFHLDFRIVNKKSEYITYAENIENVKKSKCVIEINQNHQSGLSLRTLEALFFNKKLLTNNNYITSYNFYCPQNIFILGKDNLSELKDFLNSDYKEIPNSIKKEYDINEWIKYFI